MEHRDDAKGIAHWRGTEEGVGRLDQPIGRTICRRVYRCAVRGRVSGLEMEHRDDAKGIAHWPGTRTVIVLDPCPAHVHRHELIYPIREIQVNPDQLVIFPGLDGKDRLPWRLWRIEYAGRDRAIGLDLDLHSGPGHSRPDDQDQACV